MSFKDITNNVYGNLKVIKRVDNDKYNNAQWLCKCSCGKECVVLGYHLRTGHTTSCGNRVHKKGIQNPCYRHGKRNTRLYKIYYNMKDRCYNVNNKKYNCYGKRGIKICDEWLSDFMNFYNWAIDNGYDEKLTIDRINNDGNYEPDNCRWLSRQAQNWNTSRTKNRPPDYIIKELHKVDG